MKTETRIKVDNSDMLRYVFEKAYFSNDNNGALSNIDDVFLTLGTDHEYYNILTDLVNMECRITNDEVISGTAKFIIIDKDKDGVYLKPTSLFCIKESEEIYNFY